MYESSKQAFQLLRKVHKHTFLLNSSLRDFYVNLAGDEKKKKKPTNLSAIVKTMGHLPQEILIKGKPKGAKLGSQRRTRMDHLCIFSSTENQCV